MKFLGSALLFALAAFSPALAAPMESDDYSAASYDDECGGGDPSSGAEEYQPSGGDYQAASGSYSASAADPSATGNNEETEVDTQSYEEGQGERR